MYFQDSKRRVQDFIQISLIFLLHNIPGSSWYFIKYYIAARVPMVTSLEPI